MPPCEAARIERRKNATPQAHSAVAGFRHGFVNYERRTHRLEQRASAVKGFLVRGQSGQAGHRLPDRDCGIRDGAHDREFWPNLG